MLAKLTDDIGVPARYLMFMAKLLTTITTTTTSDVRGRVFAT
ncbi:MAG: hypothetical protein AAF250_13275 [Pseudomonadota bacterium]